MIGKTYPPITMPEDCDICHVCRKPIGPLHRWRVNDAGYKVHQLCVRHVHTWIPGETLGSSVCKDCGAPR